MATRSRRTRGRQSSGWPFLAVGLALGLAVAAGVYFSDLRSGTPSAARPDPAASRGAPRGPAAPERTRPAPAGTRSADAASSADATDGESVAAAADEPRFDFYDILPRFEVVVPEVETVTRSSEPPAPIAAPGSYVLQTGSFRSHADADRMQASLALLGIESRIQKVTIDADEFHRVRVGPINDLDELDRVRTELRRAGVESLMMKVND